MSINSFSYIFHIYYGTIFILEFIKSGIVGHNKHRQFFFLENSNIFTGEIVLCKMSKLRYYPAGGK